jgi:integrase
VKSGPHLEAKLSDLKVRQLKTAGRYGDGGGLYLVVDPSGAKRWILRTMVKGARRDIGLGGVSTTSLAEAREKAREYRKVARGGGDPIATRRQERAAGTTFREVAVQTHEAIKDSFSNAKHSAQWLTTLETYAFPTLRDRRINDIGTPDILRVLSPIWLEKPPTASRLMQRLHRVFQYAKAAGLRVGDNPVEGVASGLPKQSGPEGHHDALPFKDLPAFMQKLDAVEPSTSRLALKLVILTAARTSEVLLARWDEFDLAEKVWTVPAERMKARRAHRVPLSTPTLEVLRTAKKYSGNSVFVFPGQAIDKPMSNMAMLNLLKRMKVKVTVHGFRSTFRDWAAEATDYPNEEAAFA